MKLYIIPPINGEDGVYHILSEKGEALASHLCSNLHWAISDLEGRRPERQKEWKEKFGEYKVIILGDDGMTREELIRLNQELYEKELRK